MDYVEAEGNSIDEAIERALEQLGVPREKVEIEILTNSARGLFGLGGRKARVRATIRAALQLASEAVADGPGLPGARSGPPRAARTGRPRVPAVQPAAAVDVLHAARTVEHDSAGDRSPHGYRGDGRGRRRTAA